MKRKTTIPESQPSRLHHFTPLRYPGGKGKLAAFVKELMKRNELLDGEYVEPYAGGAAIALELLLQEYVSRIHINDICRPIYAFWKSVLDDTERLVRLIRNTPLTVQTWDRQKAVIASPEDHDDLDLGFAAFFLNRTNRSGILNGGIIGGRDQSGPWKIDARFNANELIHRVESIAKLRSRINLSREDAEKFLLKRLSLFPEKTLVYLDPPYYVKGKELYYHYYTHQDHEDIAALVTQKICRQKWIVSYDNVVAIQNMYADCRSIVYGIGYSAREARAGSEVMFFCSGLEVPPLTGAMKLLGKRAA
ncbi:MAG: DNA adenine methylase [Nitrososphaerota archaeon]|jgi:DNA adenine methylase|nr:DNA adenine methylase [Nitrososphaerota archaeon]MDG6923957.1 DNA adenine methylase [Nitrososphaerota archaeon]